MRLSEISNIRLINQRIARTEFSSAKEIVSWMGAMQAQDYPMAKLAAGIRLIKSTEDSIEEAMNKGEIIRTHVMRPTWHFIAAEDVYWMLELTSSRIKAVLRTRHKHLGFTNEIIFKSHKILERALLKGKNLTRDELSKEFVRAKIRTDENRLSHLLVDAEINGILCSGPIKKKRQTYSLLSMRVSKKKILTREESLAELAKRYFSSHGPATIADFTWWSGLQLKDAKQGLYLVKSEFDSEKTDSVEYWFKGSSTNKKISKPTVHLLPAYDEFLISYKDRSASLGLINNKKIISSNGIFRPVVLVDGLVAGTWKSTRKNEDLIFEISFLEAPDKIIKERTVQAVRKIGDFSGMKPRISFSK